jgi:hypothetical protein
MTDKMVEAYLKALGNEERAAASIEKYRRALLSFAALLRPALLERNFFREGEADDPTNISSVLRRTGKDYFACPVGY